MPYNGNIGIKPLSEAAYGSQQAEIRSAFEKLALPLPERGEYMHIRKGYLIGLPQYGAVLRAERNDIQGICMPISHPLVLQPIGTIMAEEQRFELCPGVPKIGVSREDYAFLIDAIRASGLHSDASNEDCGYLPVKTQAFPNGIPVIIDRTDVCWETPNLANVFDAQAFAHLPAETIHAQSQYYGALQRAFDHFQRNPDTEAASNFWQVMRQATKDGQLFSLWRPYPEYPINHQHMNKGDELWVSAYNYGRSIGNFGPHVQSAGPQ